MKKILFILFACFVCMNVLAQDYYESSSDIYGLGSSDYQKKWVRTFSFSIAKQAEFGFNIRRNFGRYFAWDVYGFDYGYDFLGTRELEYEGEIEVTHEFKFLRSGIRLFTPQFGKFKCFGAVGVGGEYVFCDKTYYRSYYSKSKRSKDGTALFIDLQLGVYVSKRFSIGYQAIFHRLTDDGDADHTDHMFRMAFDF